MVNERQFLDQAGLDILLANIRAKMDAIYAAKNESETITGSQDKADAALSAAKEYTDEKVANIASPEANEQIASHNTSNNAHNDIRESVTNALAAAKDYSNNNLDTARNYIDDQIDKIPDWAMNSNKPNYSAEEVGADPSGSANNALTQSKSYTDEQIRKLEQKTAELEALTITNKLAEVEVIE